MTQQDGGTNQGGSRPATGRGGLGAIPYAVVLLAVVVSIGAAAYVAYAARSKDETVFTEQVKTAHATIHRRLDLYVSTLRSAAGLFAVNPDVTRAEFAEYAGRIDIRNNYPGL